MLKQQDANSKLNSLQMQHQMLKVRCTNVSHTSTCDLLLISNNQHTSVQNQHEDLKKQYYELQDQHEVQGQDHNRLLGQHREHLVKLQQVKDGEISQLKGTHFTQTHEKEKLHIGKFFVSPF